MAEDLARSEPNGVLFADQWNNMANRRAHFDTTGPELWEQTDGKIDGFICAVGTGGTLAGVSMALKDRNKDIQIGLADPMGAALYSHYKFGELKSEGSSISEGIGQGRITANLEGIDIDHPFQISDDEMLPIVFDLLKEEGLGDVLVIVGGIIPESDRQPLLDLGISGVFGPGTSTGDISEFIEAKIEEKGVR